MTKSHDKYKHLIGKKFNRLTIIECNKASEVICYCECGNKKIVNRLYCILNGETGSCGCLYKEKLKEIALKHGHTKGGKRSLTHSSWSQMIQRCKSNREIYRNWNGKGIKVCERWLVFANFLEDMGERPSREYSIDRIDSTGNYSPENCRWATIKQQNRNMSTNLMIEYDGKRLCAKEWSEVLGVNYKTILSRKARGWSDKKTIEKLIGKYATA